MNSMDLLHRRLEKNKETSTYFLKRKKCSTFYRNKKTSLILVADFLDIKLFSLIIAITVLSIVFVFFEPV